MIPHILFFLFSSVLLFAEINLPHQGRVSVNNKPFTGNAEFRFALIDQFQNLVWNHNSGTREPTNGVQLSVQGGFYNYDLNVPNEILNLPHLKLRIWFDDGKHGLFQLGQDQPLPKLPYSVISDLTNDPRVANNLTRLDPLQNSIRDAENSILDLNKSLNNLLAKQVNISVADTQILDRLNRLESNQTLITRLAAIDNQIQELNASKADMIATAASITYEMLSPEVAGKLDGNRSLPVLSTEASAKINELQGQLEIALNRIAVLETSQSSGGFSPKILAKLGYRELPDSNLSGVNLSNLDLDGANFSGTNLNGANLYKVDLSNSNLTRADLTGSNLEEAILVGSDLTNANFTGATLGKVNLSNADLSKVALRGMDLSQANLTGTSFNHSDLRGAKLRSTLNASNLNGAILSDAQYPVDLNGSTLDGNFSGFNFSGVDLQNTILGQSVFFEDVNFTRAQLQGTEVPQGARTVEFSYSDFSDANLSGAVFYKSTFTYQSWGLTNYVATSDFSYAVFHNTDLSKANLQGANFSNADLSRVNFTEANLANANLSGALIDLSSIANASSVLGINFTGLDLRTITDLSILDFRGSTWTGANFSGMDFSTGVNLGGTATSVDGRTTTNVYGGFTQNVPGSYTFNVVDFSSVNLSKANLVNLEMSGIILDGADLQNAKLSGASLGGLSVSYKPSFGSAETTVQKYASLIGANLKGADLSNTNLKGANMTDADLTGATFSNTIMPDGTVRNN